MDKFRNIVLVTYDCARADVIWNMKNTTFASLSDSGCQFRNAISSSPLTPVSHATIFSGLFPFNHGLRRLFREPLGTEVPTLAETLSDAGFFTAALVSCPGLVKWYGHSRGFQHYDDWLPPLPDGSDPLSVPDVKLRGLALKRADQVAERAKKLIPRLKSHQKWFMFLHFFDAHWPYEPPVVLADQQNPYEGELRYADAHFEIIVDGLKDAGLFDETLFVILGDHGEDLAGWYPNDKAGPNNLHPEEEGHGCCLYQQTQHVPLMFSNSAFEKRKVETPVGLVDVAPTIAALAGTKLPTPIDGIDLSKTIRSGSQPTSRIMYAETMHPREMHENTGAFPEISNSQCIWLNKDQKVIRWFDRSPEFLKYDLITDPLEQSPVQANASDIAMFDWPDQCGGQNE